MSKTILFIVALGIAVVGSTRIASAQCTNADLCNAAECQNRQVDVTTYCKGAARSCTKVSTTDKVTLRLYLTRNQDCLDARLNVQKCFSTTDAGHQQAINEVNNAIATCQNKLNK